MEDLMLSLFICLFIPLAMSLAVLVGKSRELFVFFLSGIFVCLFAGQINGLMLSITNLDSYTLTTSVTPIVEEMAKMIPVLILAFVIDTDRQTLLECALMVGLGFATMENVYILMSNADAVSITWAFSRGLGSAMLHATTALVVAYGISFCKVRKKTFVTGTYAMLLGAMVIHGIYNMLVQSSKYMHLGLLLPTVLFLSLAVTILKQRKEYKK